MPPACRLHIHCAREVTEAVREKAAAAGDGDQPQEFWVQPAAGETTLVVGTGGPFEASVQSKNVISSSASSAVERSSHVRACPAKLKSTSAGFFSSLAPGSYEATEVEDDAGSYSRAILDRRT